MRNNRPGRRGGPVTYEIRGLGPDARASVFLRAGEVEYRMALTVGAVRHHGTTGCTTPYAAAVVALDVVSAVRDLKGARAVIARLPRGSRP